MEAHNDATRQYLLNSQSRGVKDEVVQAEVIHEHAENKAEFAWAEKVSSSEEAKRASQTSNSASQVSAEISNLAPVYGTSEDSEFGSELLGEPSYDSAFHPDELEGKQKTKSLFRQSYE
ncbi:hypothetical protein [Paenibacillus sp. Marseille-Q4541]|uniref:hypothetical protein n=1 Tax=Paenibacillus sp. Marseille-Q4541 TaxID=2831522 RepID=UPI001BAA4E10|nr:hypothetical protein [Paenibacillus sp. Marseille-Q4541]